MVKWLIEPEETHDDGKHEEPEEDPSSRRGDGAWGMFNRRQIAELFFSVHVVLIDAGT